jgi:hypothetical protein
MDLAFVRLYLNDFEKAKQGDDSNDVSIPKYAYVQLLPCGVISQFSRCREGVKFVGGIKVELIDSCQTVLQDVSNFFAYDTFIQDGLPQINWEFGKVGKDYYYRPLFLKITDLINEDVYYSSRFLMTNMDSELSTNFVYTENTRFRGIPYDLKPFYQQVRFYKCFYKDSANTTNLKEYTQTSGRIMNYRNIITFIKVFVFDKLDIAIDNRMYEMFAHSIVYANDERIKLQSYESEEIVGDTNWKTATINVNPQDEYLTLGTQLLEGFTLDTFTPNSSYTVDLFPNDIIGVFNQVITLGIGTLKIYDEFNTLIVTFTQADIVVDGNLFGIDNSSFVKDLKAYYVIISEGLFKGDGCSNFKVTDPSELTFEIVGGQYDSEDYDTTNDYT